MNNYENKIDKNSGINYTRYIASWLNATHDSYLGPESNFESWLRYLNLDDDDITNILYLARNGKLELEQYAKKYMILMSD